jgi:hypothetical protein
MAKHAGASRKYWLRKPPEFSTARVETIGEVAEIPKRSTVIELGPFVAPGSECEVEFADRECLTAFASRG